MAKNDVGMGRLTAKECATLGDGRWSDGQGLSLRVRGAGTPQESRSWTLRFYNARGEAKELGLGKLAEVDLAAARDLRHEHRKSIKADVDPLETKRAKRAAVTIAARQEAVDTKIASLTLLRACRAYHALRIAPKRGNAKHQSNWLTSIENNLSEKLLNTPLAQVVSVAHVGTLIDELNALIAAKPESGVRIRQRLGLVTAYYEVRGEIPRNPMPSITKETRPVGHVRGHHAALPYAEMPALMRRMETEKGIAALAARFTILCTARTGEVLGLTHREIDLAARVWTLPAARTKTKREHVVPLSDAALAVLHAAREVVRAKGASLALDALVFPNLHRKIGKPLSTMAMLAVLERIGYSDRTTIHGAGRSSFSTRANELNIARSEVIEACLAHVSADKVKSAYDRAQHLDARRLLLNEWATFLTTPPATAHAAPAKELVTA